MFSGSVASPSTVSLRVCRDTRGSHDWGLATCLCGVDGEPVLAVPSHLIRSPAADGPRPPPWVFNMCGACAVTVSGWRSGRRRTCRAGSCRRSASRLRPRLVGVAARSSATFDVTGGGRRSQLSVERDDDLAVGAALLDVGQRLEGLVKWEGLVDDRAEVAGVVEGGQFAQLGAVGLHEQERVAHT